MDKLADLIDEQAIKYRRQKHFDLGVISDVFQRALATAAPEWQQLFDQGAIVPLRVAGQKRRVLHLGADSALALLLSYRIPALLEAINSELDDLQLEDIRLVHQQHQQHQQGKLSP